jgi:hypothetical protein
MNDRKLQTGRGQDTALVQGSPGILIVAGAVALAYGATTLVGALYLFITLGTQPPELDTLDMRAFRAPALHAALWVTIVESAFLAVAGVGLTRLREWARSLFIALALMHAAVIAHGLWVRGPEGPAHLLALTLLRDVALYGGGAWLLLRPHVARLFRGTAK